MDKTTRSVSSGRVGKNSQSDTTLQTETRAVLPLGGGVGLGCGDGGGADM